MKEYYLVPVHQYQDLIENCGNDNKFPLKNTSENSERKELKEVLVDKNLPSEAKLKLYNFFSKNPKRNNIENILQSKEISPETTLKLYNFLKNLGLKFDEKSNSENKVSWKNISHNIKKQEEIPLTPTTSIPKTSFANENNVGTKRSIEDTFENSDDENEDSNQEFNVGDSDATSKDSFTSYKKFKTGITTSGYKNEHKYGNLSNAQVENLMQDLIDLGVISMIDTDTISNGTNFTNVKDFVRSLLLPNKILSDDMVKFLSPFFFEIPREYIRNSRLQTYFNKGGIYCQKWLKY